MKFSIFGLTISSSWGNGHATPYRALLRALHRMGHEAVFFEKDVPYYAARRDFNQCDYCRLVLYQDWRQIRNQALQAARESDVVICASYCPEGARVADEALALDGPLRIFYDLDTPITLERLALHDLDYLRGDQIPEFDLVLSFTGGAVLGKLRNDWGAQRCAVLYGCVDADEHRPVTPRPEFDCALSYMGTYASDRQSKLESLLLEPAAELSEQTFILAGALYPQGSSWPRNLRRFEHLAPDSHPAFYCSSRATLNITRAGMIRDGYCPSGRFFEATACGAPIITDWWEGLDEFFNPADEIFVAKTGADVVDALQRHNDLLERAGRARQRTLDEHTGRNRALELIRYCEEAKLRAPGVVYTTTAEAAHKRECAEERSVS